MKLTAVAFANQPFYTDGNEVDVTTDDRGNLYTRTFETIPTGATYENGTTGAVDLTTTTPFQMFAAQGAGTHHYLTSILMTNSGTTDSVVYIEDGSTIIQSANVKAGSGYVWVPTPYFYQPTANQAINIVCRTSGAAIQANAVGFWK